LILQLPSMTESANQDNLKLAIGAIVTGCLALSLGDALIKQHSASFVLWQIFLVRSLITLPFLVYLARIHSCRDPIKPKALAWTLLRSLLLVVMWMFYFAALPHIDFAVAAAAFYTLPLFITLFAAVFLDERISVRGWLAIATGFVGTLLILQPQAGEFNAWATLPLVSAVLYACAMILTRSKCRHEKPAILSLWLNIGFVAAGSIALLGLKLWRPGAELVAWNPFLFGAWTPMWLEEWRTMGILAVAIMAGSIGAAFAYQKGPASTVALFDFSYVGFAAIWGLVIFAEMPAPPVLLGIFFIVVAGMLVSLKKSTR
jgi:drug/metabolite transporter (DMT)-like permease